MIGNGGSIGWELAVSNIPTLPRRIRETKALGDGVLKTFCEIAAGLSNMGYGMKIPHYENWPNPGIAHASPPKNQEDNGVVAPEDGQDVVVPGSAPQEQHIKEED